MSSDLTQAVFISYASQDAEVARRICEALRAAEVEVWFDLNELRGGDSWDAKIRRQIKDCALFMPLISASTNARAEGYFRLEWKLAVDRSHLMSDDHPFLFPVVIDDTVDASARVPDKFRDLQWTRLRLDETPVELSARVARLLRGAPIDRPKVPRAENGSRALRERKHKPRWLRYAWVAVGLVFALVYALRPVWQPARLHEKKSTVTARADAALSPSPAPASKGENEWPKDAELKRAIGLIDSLDATREDFLLADEIASRAWERAPADPDVLTVRARVHSAFLLRNFDFSSERVVLAKRFGERAVQLSPDNPEALYALSIYLSDRAGDPGRAESLARRACELAPNVPRLWRQVQRAVSAQRPDDGLALAEELILRFPRDALAHYELSIAYRNRRDWVKFEREIDATLALAPLANALNWKARAALVRKNLPEMRQWLDQVTARARSEERTVSNCVIYALLSGDYDYGLKALQRFADPWFYDANTYSGPAALLRATLLAQQGKVGQARAQYEIAVTELAHFRAEKPSDLSTQTAEMWAYFGAGRLEEARAAARTVREDLRRPYRIFAMTAWWFDVIPASLLVDDRATALQLIREAASQPEGRKTIRDRMERDPRMTPFARDPEIAELLADSDKSP